jgi:TrmH family RNA methyltransferase
MGISREKQKLIRRLHNPRFRVRERLFVVEGIRSTREFLGATLPLEIRFALVSPRLEGVEGGEELRNALGSLNVMVEEVEDRELAALSGTERIQGVLLVVEEPRDHWPWQGRSDPWRVVILDGIQDPGNLGALVRVARAFGIQGVLALEGTVDPWNPKAVRGGAGAAAHLPVRRSSWPEARAWLRRQEIPLIVADPEGTDVRNARFPEAWALVLGNEGRGVRQEIREEADALLSVPMLAGVDSLNVAVAGAVLLFSLAPAPHQEGEP